MKRKRTRTSSPLAIFWTRRDQRRFIDAVEKLVATANDLAFLFGKHSAEMAAHEAKQTRRRRTPATTEPNNDNGVSP